MKLLSVVTPPAIYHGCPTQKTFWKENCTPVNMKSRRRHNVRKYIKIENGEQYIALDIYWNIYCMENREVNYSE